MREILFRGKHEICTDYGEWVIGYLSILEDGVYSISCYEQEMSEIKANSICLMRQKNVLKSYRVLPETVGQFTGLTDRNGKRIFEGDIIKSCEYDDIYTVKYFGYNNYPAFDCVPEVSNCECNGLSFLVNVEGCEVIGNIYDNPELIKE